jgi:hypothetical protein
VPVLDAEELSSYLGCALARASDDDDAGVFSVVRRGSSSKARRRRPTRGSRCSDWSSPPPSPLAPRLLDAEGGTGGGGENERSVEQTDAANAFMRPLQVGIFADQPSRALRLLTPDS